MLIYSFYSFDSIYSFELIFLNAPPSTHLSCFTESLKPSIADLDSPIRRRGQSSRHLPEEKEIDDHDQEYGLAAATGMAVFLVIYLPPAGENAQKCTEWRWLRARWPRLRWISGREFLVMVIGFLLCHTRRYVSSHLSDQSFVLLELTRFRVKLSKCGWNWNWMKLWVASSEIEWNWGNLSEFQ